VLPEFLLSLILMLLLGVYLGEDFVFKVIYLLVGAYLVGAWWSQKAFTKVRFTRQYESRVFLNEVIPVTIEISNQSWLPLLWLRLQESIPSDLSLDRNIQQVVGLGPYGKNKVQYRLMAHRRGYYRIGPLSASTGDLLGLYKDQRRSDEGGTLTVYPQIVPLRHVKLPSQSPLGALRHTQPIYEDPARIRSKRDYQVGDSLRRVDWKTSAAAGRLQVKQFEPSIALETTIFLNLHAPEYPQRYRLDTTELAVVVAASLANWISSQKESVGLITNGMDPFSELDAGEDLPRMGGKEFRAIPPARGSGQLMRILDVLARVQVAETTPAVERLRQEYVRLSWGTTLILICGHMDEALFEELFQLRRAGLNLMLVLVGRIPGFASIQARARYFRFPLYSILTTKDLDLWRL
jgi:uncharacterized protein (DUF58 family)